MKAPVLFLPGLGSSGPDHWQSLWEAADPTLRRVVQRDWDRPQLSEWLQNLQARVAECESPPVLAAHSLGCALVAHWAKNFGHGIKGALLVAAPDVDSPDRTPPETRGFSPMPLVRLPFPSILIASTNDPFVSLARAEFFAASWGSRFVTIPGAGHLNAESGIGDWPEGRRLLEQLREA